MQQLILVNDQDEQTGSMEKLEVHQKGLLHRAFSIFLFNTKGEMLLQKRATKKYHSGGLWSNTCCSHPTNGETLETAASKRLDEEMGITTPITEVFSFLYKTEFDNGLTEHEFDHVFTGIYEGEITPDPEEVEDYCYMSMEAIRESLFSHPQKYTSWFTIAFPKLEAYMKRQHHEQ